MKKVLFICSILIVVGCKTEKKQENFELTPNNQFKLLESLNDSLINLIPSDSKKIVDLGNAIKNKALKLYIDNQSDFTALQHEFLLQCAATGAESAKQYKDAASYFQKAQKRFPDSENAPVYLHNRARILDNIIGDKNNARLAYEDLISLYPNHQLSKNASIYLENAFGKSDQELLNLINSN